MTPKCLSTQYAQHILNKIERTFNRTFTGRESIHQWLRLFFKIQIKVHRIHHLGWESKLIRPSRAELAELFSSGGIYTIQSRLLRKMFSIGAPNASALFQPQLASSSKVPTQF